MGHRHFRPSGAAISRDTEDHLRLRLKDCFSRLYFDPNLIPALYRVFLEIQSISDVSFLLLASDKVSILNACINTT